MSVNNINSIQKWLLPWERASSKNRSFFLNALSQHDRKSAIKYVWQNVRLYEDLNSSERFLSFKDSKILEVISVDYDSAKNRPEYYQEFYKIILSMVKIKVEHTDDVGNPVGNYILFITLMKESPQSDWLITELGSGP